MRTSLRIVGIIITQYPIVMRTTHVPKAVNRSFLGPNIVAIRDEIAFIPGGIAVKPDGFASQWFKPASIRFARALILDAVAIMRDATAATGMELSLSENRTWSAL